MIRKKNGSTCQARLNFKMIAFTVSTCSRPN